MIPASSLCVNAAIFSNCTHCFFGRGGEMRIMPPNFLFPLFFRKLFLLSVNATPSPQKVAPNFFCTYLFPAFWRGRFSVKENV